VFDGEYIIIIIKLQLYQHRDQLILLKVEVYLKPPHLNIALWGCVATCSNVIIIIMALVPRKSNNPQCSPRHHHTQQGASAIEAGASLREKKMARENLC
jgi:hypothetical protein